MIRRGIPTLPPLYRYTHRVHAESLVRDGQIRLGTLFNYRRIEAHAPMIGDAHEGTAGRYDNPPISRARDLSPLAAGMVQQAFPGLGPDAIFDRCLFEQVETSPDCWIFSASMRLGAATMRSMDPTYDACVEIRFPSFFGQVIGQELINRNLVAGYASCQMRACVYRDRLLHYTEDDGVAPVAIKAPGFADQQEVRYIFHPRTPEGLEPLIMTMPALARCCRMVENLPE